MGGGREGELDLAGLGLNLEGMRLVFRGVVREGHSHHDPSSEWAE